MSFSVLRALVRKDLKLYLTDRRAVLVTVVVPLILASFFGFLFGGKKSGTPRSAIPVLWVDTDGSPLSRAVAEALRKDAQVALKPATVAAARAAVREGHQPVAVLVPAGFAEKATRAFFRGADKPTLTLLYDPSKQAAVQMVEGLLTQQVMRVVSQHVFSDRAGAGVVDEALASLKTSKLPPEERKSLRALLGSVRSWMRRPRTGSKRSATVGALSLPFTARREAVTAQGSSYNGYAHAFAGMGAQFVLFAAMELAVGILTERQRGLWKRLRAAPVSRATVLGARALSGTLIALLIMLVLFAVGAAAFGIRFQGSFPGFLCVSVAYALFAASLGLLIATVGKTVQATRGVSVLVILVLSMLGGAWIPAFLFPSWLQHLTLAIPTRWAVDGIDAVTWRGLGLGTALECSAVLLGFALVCGALAVWRFRWEEA